MGIVQIAEAFKDGRLLVRLGQLVVHILKLNALGPGVVVQLA